MKRIYAEKECEVFIGNEDSEEVRKEKGSNYLLSIISLLTMINTDGVFDDCTKTYLINTIHNLIRNKFKLPNKVFTFRFNRDEAGNPANPSIILFDIEANDKMTYEVSYDKSKHNWYIELSD